MTIRTKEEFVDTVAREHAWRVKEIAELKNVVGIKSASANRRRVLCRSGICVLYAHWEGFVKRSGTHFLDYVASQRLPLRQLQSNFVALIVKGRMDAAKSSNKRAAYVDIIDYMMNKRDTRARIPIKNVLQTRANVSTKQLKDIALCLGIDYGPFVTREKLIDSRLVEKRNHIAHGEEMELDETEFVDLADEVVALIGSFRALIENSVTLEEYKMT